MAIMLTYGILSNFIYYIAEYPDDRLLFYDTLVRDYKSYFSDSVKVCFQEYKFKSAAEVSMNIILGIAEFQLIMCRLRYKYGETVNGGTLQQGFASGNHNYMGLKSQSEKIWVSTSFTDMWDLFGTIFSMGMYVETIHNNRSPKLQIELFELPDGYAFLYSNKEDHDIPFVIENTTSFKHIDNIDSPNTGAYLNVLPAMSTGLVTVTDIVDIVFFHESRNSVEVIPNWGTGIINITIPDKNDLTVSVYNSSGKKVGSFINQKTIDLSYILTGIFFVVIKTMDEYTIKKICKFEQTNK